MSAPAASPAPATSKPDPKVNFLLGLAVVAILYLLGGAINEFLSQFGLGLSNFSNRAANGANAMDAVFRFLFKLSLGIATFAIPVACFKAVSALEKLKTPAAGAAPLP